MPSSDYEGPRRERFVEAGPSGRTRISEDARPSYFRALVEPEEHRPPLCPHLCMSGNILRNRRQNGCMQKCLWYPLPPIIKGTSVWPQAWHAIGAGGTDGFAFTDCRRFTGAGLTSTGEAASDTMRVGFRETDFRFDRLLSAPGGLMDFIVYGGATA